MSRGQRLASLAVAAVIAVVAIVVLRPGSQDDDDPRQTSPTGQTQPTSQSQRGRGRPAAPPKPQYETIRFEGGRPVGGAKDITVESGEIVRLAIRSDEPEEIHIHDYDRYVDVEPGKVERVRFPARLEGVFEIEAHSDGTELANLRVEP